MSKVSVSSRKSFRIKANPFVNRLQRSVFRLIFVDREIVFDAAVGLTLDICERASSREEAIVRATKFGAYYDSQLELLRSQEYHERGLWSELTFDRLACLVIYERSLT